VAFAIRHVGLAFVIPSMSNKIFAKLLMYFLEIVQNTNKCHRVVTINNW
jgi:hypothetical protein